MYLRQTATLIAAVLGATGLIAAADVGTTDLKRTARLTEKGFTARCFSCSGLVPPPSLRE